MKHYLIILAAGASSRMKRSEATTALTDAEIVAANSQSKALLKVGQDERPLLDYLLLNAEQAGYSHVILIVPPQAEAFTSQYGNAYRSLNISYATQQLPLESSKPLGTADALFQALEQYPQLKTEVFTVCNSDNLYSVGAMKLLLGEKSNNALIAYDREGLQFSPSRIAGFALLLISSEGYLQNIIEKPNPEEVKDFQDTSGRLRVSMNLWKLHGSDIYPILKQLKPHPIRKEKELPTAILQMIQNFPKQVKAIPLSEHVPDLTSKEDIVLLKEYIRNHYNS